MSNRWFRFVIAVVAIAAAGAASYRVFQYEQQLSAELTTARAAKRAADSAIVAATDLKASLHAYVAAGQGHDFWIARAQMLLGSLRGSIAELEQAAGTSVSLTDTRDVLDRIATAEKRARGHRNAGQQLLAGEVIFTEARDLLDTLRLGMARVRDDLAQSAGSREAQVRRDQVLLAGGAAAVLVLAVLVLVPLGKPAAPLVAREVTPEPMIDEFRVVSRVPLTPPPVGTKIGAPSTEVSGSTPRTPALAADSKQPEAGSDAIAPVSGLRLAEAASVCTDLGRVSQTNEISSLLSRAASVLSASGVIVWVASENRDELFPAAASGYDERLFARIGSIRRDSANLTAAAFRDGSPRTSPRGSSSAAALAVPLLTPQGSIGVLSAEFRDLAQVDADRLAVATIFAAQFANLLAAINTTADVIPEAQAQNG